MNWKKKLKAFFTMKRRANDGFTLVELIVVIAILAILGGVAIPAYSGYVKKANEAADYQLLGAVNTAFAAACLDNGTDTKNTPSTPKLVLTNEKAVAGVNVFSEAFAQYYAGNENAKFKTDNAIIFDGLNGMFVLFTDGTTVFLKYGDDLIPISAEDAKKLANSTFIKAADLGVEGLMEQIDFVATVAASIDNGSMYAQIIKDVPFKRAFLMNLGVEGADTMSEAQVKLQFTKVSKEQTNAALIQMGYEDPTTAPADVANAVSNKVMANMAVLYAAQSTQNLSDADINTLLTNADPKEIIKGATGEDGDKLAQAALYYGMYVSYAHSSQGSSDLIAATENPVNFFDSNVLATEGFKTYINSNEGKADLEAYKASMNMIVDGTNNSDSAVGNLVVNGFTDSELLDLINQAVGK